MKTSRAIGLVAISAGFAALVTTPATCLRASAVQVGERVFYRGPDDGYLPSSWIVRQRFTTGLIEIENENMRRGETELEKQLVPERDVYRHW